MAVRTPLILDGSNNLIEMTTAQINAVKDRCRYLYGDDPSVIVNRIATNGGGGLGNLGTINDTRLQAGASTTDVTNFDTEAETPNVSTVTVGYGYMVQTGTATNYSTDTNQVAYPIYYDNGNIKSMSITDFKDTFIEPAMTTVSGSAGQPGTYTIHTTLTLSGYTSVSDSEIFRDTRANVGAYSASTIGEQQDQPTTITSYFLMKADNIAAPSIETMLFTRNADADIQQYAGADMDTLLQEGMQSEAWSHLTYNINGSGINLGSGMANTVLNGTGNYQTRLVNTDDYRTQEFPNGAVIVEATHRLKMQYNPD